jgi:hypothetical protein
MTRSCEPDSGVLEHANPMTSPGTKSHPPRCYPRARARLITMRWTSEVPSKIV